MESKIDIAADLVELLWQTHQPVEDLIRLDDPSSDKSDEAKNNMFLLEKKKTEVESMPLKILNPVKVNGTPSSADTSGVGSDSLLSSPTVTNSSDTGSANKDNATKKLILSSPLQIDVPPGETSPPPFSCSSATQYESEELEDKSTVVSDTRALSINERSAPVSTDTGKSFDMGQVLGVVFKMQRSLETLGKRFVNVETAVFDLLDEKQNPIRSGLKAEKSIQTDTSIGCQSLLTYLTKNKNTKEIQTSPDNCIFRPPSKPVRAYDKFNFEETTTTTVTVKSTSTEGITPIKQHVDLKDIIKDIPVPPPKTKPQAEQHRSIWLKDDESDSDDTDATDGTEKDRPQQQQGVTPNSDNIPDEMKSNVSLPWYDANKVWTEQHIELEEQLRKVNAKLSDHLRSRPKRPEIRLEEPQRDRKASSVAGISPYNKPPAFHPQTPPRSVQFCDKLQDDYMLPPHPHNIRIGLPNPPRQPVRRAVYQTKQMGRPRERFYYNNNNNYSNYYNNGCDRQRSVSQVRNQVFTGSNAIAPKTNQEQQQQGYRQGQQQWHQPNQQNTVKYGEPTRHDRRLIEAQRRNNNNMNCSAGHLKAETPMKSYTRRGTGVFTSDEEEDAK